MVQLFDVICLFIFIYSMISSSSLSKEKEKQNSYDLMVKFDRILRLYRCCKIYDQSESNRVRQQCQKLLIKLKMNDQESYIKYEQKLRQFMKSSIEKQQKVEKKKTESSQKASSSSFLGSSFNQSSSQSHSLNELMKSKASAAFQKKQQSISNIPKSNVSIQNSFNNLSNIQSQQIKSQEIKSQEIQSQGINSLKSPESSDSSIIFQREKITLDEYYKNYSQNFFSRLAFNQDLLMEIKDCPERMTCLLGVQKPESLKTQKLYFCTSMEFGIQEVSKFQNIEKYVEERQVFEGNMRYPLGLMVKGTNINDMRMQYVKFLLEMKSPCPIVIILNSSSLDNSIIIMMTQIALKTIKMKNRNELADLNQNFMRDSRLYKKTLMQTIERTSQKYFQTKFLKSTLMTSFQNKRAISVGETEYIHHPGVKARVQQQVEIKKQSLEQKVKIEQKMKTMQTEEKFEFKFKFSKKIFTNKQTFLVFNVNDKFELFRRKGMEKVEDTTAYIKGCKEKSVLCSVLKADNAAIPTPHLVEFLKNKDLAPIFMLICSNINYKKLLMFRFRENATETELSQIKLSFSEIEKNTPAFIEKIIFFPKATLSSYQGDFVIEEIN